MEGKVGEKDSDRVIVGHKDWVLILAISLSPGESSQGALSTALNMGVKLRRNVGNH